MPTRPTPLEERIKSIKQTLRDAANLLFSHPAIALLALLAWGVSLLSTLSLSLYFVQVILSWIFAAAFFGAVSVRYANKSAPITWGVVGDSIRRLTIGMVAITMVYSLPILILVPIINGLLSLGLEGESWVLVVAAVPTIVPSLTAMWSLAYRRSQPQQALADGLTMLRGKWLYALLLGGLYQTLAYGEQYLRFTVAEYDTLLPLPIVVLWAAVEAIFRIGLLLRLFPDSPKESSNRRRQKRES